MILGDVEEVITTVEIDDETYEEIVRVSDFYYESFSPIFCFIENYEADYYHICQIITNIRVIVIVAIIILNFMNIFLFYRCFKTYLLFSDEESL